MAFWPAILSWRPLLVRLPRTVGGCTCVPLVSASSVLLDIFIPPRCSHDTNLEIQNMYWKALDGNVAVGGWGFLAGVRGLGLGSLVGNEVSRGSWE